MILIIFVNCLMVVYEDISELKVGDMVLVILLYF